jgi:predicted RNA-binding Zn-ribbon protein involved in translation (DUF1610 family)
MSKMMELTEDERSERLKAVDECIAAFWKKLQTVQEAQAQRRVCIKTCALCGEAIYSKSGHVKFCEKCRPTAREILKQKYLEQRNAEYHAAQKRKYAEGIIYICSVCGDKIRVHERVNRKVCDRCYATMGSVGRQRLNARKPVHEEVIHDV